MTLKAKSAIKNTKATTNKYSLEKQLKTVAVAVFGIISVLIFWVMSLLALSTLVKLTILTLIIVPLGMLIASFYQKMIMPFYSLTNLVEAIRLEDYSLRARDQYQSGVMHSLSQEISLLSDELQQRKQVYDQHTLLIYHLIEQLDAPIAIFNHKLQLSHANAAFSGYIGQPWQTKRLTRCQNLGLIFESPNEEMNESAGNSNNQWSFIKENEQDKWQIKHSHFIQNEQQYYLVILTNVEVLLRKNQQESWQQIIRVMSHEIRNSLTPIKSLAQTLVEQPDQAERSKQALNVIVERSIALQEFVNRYGDITQKVTIKPIWIESSVFFDSLMQLFSTQEFELNIKYPKIWADPILLKQVMINLIKNAIEANCSSDVITLNIYVLGKQSNLEVSIEVIDKGQGIANPENIFVPFYTTKKHGHGIGLGLCQNIIAQHKGRLTLFNNPPLDNQSSNTAQGAIAKITLPIT